MQNIIVGRYDHPQAVGYQGWIEPANREWIAFIALDGKPAFFLNREVAGAVIPPK